nr:MAG TPA: PROTEIN (SINR PROTEIN) REGULATOR, ANTAGONIST, SPORULATION.9A [Caudoviricetes sp.]
MSSRKKIADYFCITVEELMSTKKEPAGMGGLDKQMQEIVELLNNATPEQRNAVETLLRSRIKPE